MANTVIALKKSATPSSVPSNLANGELAINYADGKLYYKAANGTIASISSGTNSFGTVNANNTLVVADVPGGIFSIVSGNNIAITGDAVNDKVTVGLTNDVNIPGKMNVASDFTHTGGVFYINNGSGAGGTSEGGEIQLANATQNQVLSGRVSIDIYENKLRFFETNSPNRGAFINIASASAGVGTDLLATASATDSLARATASQAFDKANAALPNVSGVSFNGNLTVSQNLTADRVFTNNNGNGENLKIGDDAWIGDTNLANAIRLKGQQNASIGYILFGPNDGKLLGRAGTDNLTYDGNVVWHAGSDGAGSGLDADHLDGQHGTYYGTATTVTAAFAKANSALSNTSGTVFNGELSVPTLLAGSTDLNTARLRFVESGNVSYIQSGIDVILTARPIHFAPYYSTTATMAVDLANARIGINRTNPGYALDIIGTANASNILINGNMVGTVGGETAAFARANIANITADRAWNHANASYAFANSAHAAANAGFDAANTASALATAAQAIANLAFIHANNAYFSSNGVNTYSTSTYVKLVSPSQTISGNLSITGSLSVAGNAYIIDSETLKISDPLIYLAGNNYTSDIVDIGFVGNYVNATGQNVHTGLFRDSTTKEYYVFEGYDKEPTPNHIDTAGNNFTISVLNATLKTSNLILGGANAILTIGASFNRANAAHASANAGMAIANAAFAAANAGLLQANTARDHANAAFNKANTTVTDFSPAFLQANIAYAHANASFSKANAALPNTSGAAFAGNLNLPTGNLAVGIATPNTGARLQVYNTSGNSELWITADNGYDPVLRMTGEAGATSEGFIIRYDNSVGDTYFENKFGAVTSYHFLTSVVEALTIHTDGKVGVGETNPQYILDVKGVANVSSALLVNDMNVKPTVQAAFNRANTANITADRAWNHANAAFDKANTPSGGAYYSGNNGDVGSSSGLGDIFRVHTNALNANVTIYSGNNALAAGPITVEAGKILTIQANARVAIV